MVFLIVCSSGVKFGVDLPDAATVFDQALLGDKCDPERKHAPKTIENAITERMRLFFSIKKFLISFTNSLYIVAKFDLLSFIQPKNFAAHILDLF